LAPGWSLPFNEVFDGGPGRDGIAVLQEPELIDPAAATYLNDEDMVVGYKRGDVIRAYPHKIP